MEDDVREIYNNRCTDVKFFFVYFCMYGPWHASVSAKELIGPSHKTVGPSRRDNDHKLGLTLTLDPSQFTKAHYSFNTI